MLFVDSLLTRDDDKICGFEGFTERLNTNKVFWKRNWNVFEQGNGVCLYKLRSDREFSNVTMSFKIVISNELLVSIYQNEIESDIRELNWILKNSKLELWSQFYKLAEYYQSEPTVQKSSVAFMKQALSCLNIMDISDASSDLIEPLRQQLALVVNELETENTKTYVSNSFESKLYPESKYTVEYDEEPNVTPFGMFYEKEENMEMSSCSIKSRVRRDSESNSKSLFKVPLRSETNSDIYKCQHCEKFFLSNRKLRSHLQSHVSRLNLIKLDF